MENDALDKRQHKPNSCNPIDYRYNHIFSKVQFLHFEGRLSAIFAL